MAVDISSELEIIKDEPLGESVAGAIVSALNSIHSYAYSSVDISSEITAISSSPEGSKIRIAIHDAIKKLAMAEPEDSLPIVEMTQEEYIVQQPSTYNKIHAIIDPMHVWVYSFNSETGSFTGGALMFNTATEAYEYVSSQAENTSLRFAVRLGDGPMYYSKYPYVAYSMSVGGENDWPERIYGATSESQATQYLSTYSCNYATPVAEFMSAFNTPVCNGFSSCNNLIDVVVGSETVTISDNAFTGCNNLVSIQINKARDSIPGAPWGAPNAEVIWLK